MTYSKQIEVPLEFRSQRLVMRPFRAEDANQLHLALVESIVELREYLWFLPWVAETQTLGSAETRCHNAKIYFDQRADLAYLAFEKLTGRLIASVGFHRTDWSIPKTEIGFWVRTSEAGNGYATECVSELTSWALKVLSARRVEIVTDERNMGSRAVAKNCGFHLERVEPDDMESPDNQLRNICVYTKLPCEPA